MRSYVERRHKQSWDVVEGKMDKLLMQASSFIEPLTRLPLVATLLAELLPTMNLKEVPKTSWELFNTLLLSGLIRRDLPDGDAEVMTNDFRQLPPERQEALLLLSDLALQGLLATPPKLVFRYADIVEKTHGLCKAVRKELLEVAKSVMVSFCEMDETQEVTYYHFLHLSFQEFLAAMSLRYPNPVNAEMYGVSRLASSVKSLPIGERFDNFWLFAVGFFKAEPVLFFKTLFSNTNADMTTSNKQRLAMQNMVLKMLQEMIPGINNFNGKEYSLVLESIAMFLNRKVSNLLSSQPPYFAVQRHIDFGTLCHALRLLPGLVTVDWHDREWGIGFYDVLDALQNQHNLQTLRISSSMYLRGIQRYQEEFDKEVKSLTSLLQTASVANLQLQGVPFKEEELQDLAGGLSRMNHSLKHLSLWGDEKHQNYAVAMEALCSALATHHKSLLCLEIQHIDLYSCSAMQPLASFISKPNNLERLVVRDSPMSNATFELLCSAVQRSRSLTSLKFTLMDSFDTLQMQENKNERRLRALQLSNVAIHHASVTRLEIEYSALNDTDAMNIVKEVMETKGEPHQLTQLSLCRNKGITEEGVKRFRQVVQENQLNLTIAVVNNRLWDSRNLYTGPIVNFLPIWSVFHK